MSTPISEQEKNRLKLQGFLEDKLKWHAYTHIAVDDDALPLAERFVHTIGRARAGKPELIVTGCAEASYAMDLISDVVAHELRNGPLADGPLPAGASRVALMLRDVSSPFVRNRRVAQATSRYGPAIRVVQIVWPDPAGRFPDDAAYDAAGCPQQLLWMVESGT